MKKAFSLTELLLALGIVAVVATLMITTVIPKGDQKKYSTLANKAYLILEEAYDVQIMNDAGRNVTEVGTNNVLKWMVAGGALPVYDTNASKNAVQLPNGMILNNTDSSIYVDLDGIEGKTRSTLNNPPSSYSDNKADVLRFIFDGAEITPDYNCELAKEYFEYDNILE